jgi:hypothetical protein
MKESGPSRRGLISVALAVGLVVAACGSSSASPNRPSPGASGGPGGSGPSSLVAGLSSNLDSLTSYQFSETMAGSSSGSQATPAAAGGVLITGTVVNQPTRALSINASGAMYILVGDQAWTSFDSGSTWTTMDPTDSSLADLLPGKNYATWFDAYASNFKAAGDEPKNGVGCVHYRGDSSLASQFQGTTGAGSNFLADLWVAKDGNYPVSGALGLSAASASQADSFGYSFDITNVNDAANQVTPPSNVVAIPS